MEIFKKNIKKFFGLRVLIHRYRFAISFLLLAIFSVALGAGYGVMIKKLAERPSEVFAAGSGLSNITWDNLTTGASGTAVGTTTWTIGGIALQGGMNNITLTVLDNAGNSSSTQLTVNYTGAGFTCGSPLADVRDGKSYATVQIGTQCWMKQGLNVGQRINGSVNQGTDCSSSDVIKKYCYDDAFENCNSNNNPNYPDGGLYQWDQAMCGFTVEGAQGICPTGWHIPTDAEICILEQAVDPTITCDSLGFRGTDGGTKLKPGGSSGWEGNLAGYRVPDGSFYFRTANGWLMSSTQNGVTFWIRQLSSGRATIARNTTGGTRGYPVRCVQDSATPPATTGSGGNVRGWGWNANTGWVSFNSDLVNPIARSNGTEGKSRLAWAMEKAVDSTEQFISRLARLFNYNIEKMPPAGKISQRVINVFYALANALKQGVKTAWAAAVGYGANLDPATGQFSGWAWSENTGWIYFGPDHDFTADGYPQYGNVASSSAPYENLSIDPATGKPYVRKAWAYYDSASGQVRGWAKILSLGNDGWVNMGDDSVPTWAGKGVKLTINGSQLDFSGWAWNSGASGQVGLGWLSFNAVSCDADANGFIDIACGGDNATTPINNYKTIVTGLVPSNTAPQLLATDLTAPNWASSSAISAQNALRAYLRWTFRDPDNKCVGGTNDGNICVAAGDCLGGSCDIRDSQTAYQIVIRDAATNALIHDTDKVTGIAGTANQFNASSFLNYNTSYRWWLTVWDNYDASSTIQYNNNSAVDTDSNIDGDVSTFSTFKHEFPRAYFTWLPLNPSKDENVRFLDNSFVYLTAAPTTAVRATTTPTPNAGWLWTFNNGSPATSNIPNPIAQFTSVGNTTVTLLLTDTDGYQASTSTTFNANLKLPTWQEKKPR